MGLMGQHKTDSEKLGLFEPHFGIKGVQAFSAGGLAGFNDKY